MIKNQILLMRTLKAIVYNRNVEIKDYVNFIILKSSRQAKS